MEVAPSSSAVILLSIDCANLKSPLVGHLQKEGQIGNTHRHLYLWEPMGVVTGSASACNTDSLSEVERTHGLEGLAEAQRSWNGKSKRDGLMDPTSLAPGF